MVGDNPARVNRNAKYKFNYSFTKGNELISCIEMEYAGDTNLDRIRKEIFTVMKNSFEGETK